MLDLDDTGIHVWVFTISAFTEEIKARACLGWMNSEEQARHKRFHFERHRDQYLVTRALCRTVLGHYQPEVSEQDWQFRKNEFGKPEIAFPQLRSPLYFNLSHSGDRLAMAISRHNVIGIDVETVKPERQTQQLANRFFSPAEAADLMRIPEAERGRRFFDYWTLKEAYIKACGMGLAIPLDEFSYDLVQANSIDISFASARKDDRRHWQFWQLNAGPDYKLALAVKTGTRSPALALQGFSKSCLDTFQRQSLEVLASSPPL